MSLHGRFWSTMASVTRGMLSAEETADFLRLYRRLGASLFGYLGRNLGGLALACIPLIALMFALSPLLFAPWDARAGQPTVHPAGAGVLEAPPAGDEHVLRLPTRPEPIPLAGDPARAAVCWSPAQCLLLRSLDFSVTSLERPAGTDYGAVIVRADGTSWNPLFPYLNDLEFVFFGMTMVGVSAGFLRRGRPA
jgi:hypothetical protein